jgi:molecular chaperone DnaK
MYALGIDLGTTFTAAATWRNGRAEVASLGSKGPVIPSVVLLRDDETVLTGEAASRRGLSEPQRVAREFKRRFGDTTPILLGGAPHSAEGLSAKMLRTVIDQVAAREGGPPQRICLSHPANWGGYKRELLTQVVRLANVEQQVTFTTEPEAAAAFYAHQQRIEPGSVVAVYDLGGGTFDASVLRKTSTGFEILGQPEGIERLGGIDFDAAVFNHVQQALQGKFEELDEDDPAAVSAVARLREECIAAKEALSSDTDTTIPVLLPNVSTEIRLTRAELESMVRPSLYSTIEALRRALRSAGVTPEQLHSVLLVGGASRMPLVSQLVGAELGRPVAVDAHPKHAVALGAAWLASGVRQTAPPPAGMRPGAVAGAPQRRMTGPAAAGAAAGVAGAAAAGLAGAGMASGGPPPVRPPRAPAAAPTAASFRSSGPPTPPPPSRMVRPVARPEERRTPPGEATEVVGSTSTSPVGPPPVGPPQDTEEGNGSGGRFRRIGLVVGGVLVVGLIAGGVVWATNRPSEPAAQTGGQPTTTPSAESNLPADEQCTAEIKANPRWVCLTKARYNDDGELVVEYNAKWAGAEPDINGGFHLHLYGSDGSDPAADIMGSHAGSERGEWVIKDENPAVLTPEQIDEAVGDNRKVCARIANGDHELVKDADGGYTTGNCVRIKGKRPEADNGGPAEPPAQQPPQNNPAPPPTTTTPPPTTTAPPTTTEPPAPAPTAAGEAAGGGAAEAEAAPAG